MPALAIVAATVAACAELATEPPAEGAVFDAPFAELSAGELRVFLTGDAEFSRRFAPSTGLGPVFNNASCFSCH
ncbi:MAG: di-heme oxidoredictase family protein, partial [Gemmatimonadaceae bacterium]